MLHLKTTIFFFKSEGQVLENKKQHVIIGCSDQRMLLCNAKKIVSHKFYR